MPGPYPLPTLSAKVTPTGISAPSFNDILLSLIATIQSIFGSDIFLPPDSQDYQMIAAFAMAINDQNQAMIAVYSGFSPSFAQGVSLSTLVKINGLQREPGTNSTALLTITGVVGTVISNGLVQDANQNLWVLPVSVTIPLSGSIIVTAVCATIGAIAADANTIDVIFNPQIGWQSANNPAPATVGVNAESDAALRIRQSQSTAIAAVSPLQAILSAVANVTGVQRYAIYENQSGVTDGNGVPGHSIALIVEGGDTTLIAQAIEQTKSPGTGTYGTTNIPIIDPAGLPITINFFELANVQIYVAVTIHPLTGYVASTGTALVAAIAAFINSLAIGQELFYDWVFGPATLYGSPLGQTYKINSLFIAITPSPAATADIPIAFNQAAACLIANVTLNTV